MERRVVARYKLPVVASFRSPLLESMSTVEVNFVVLYHRARCVLKRLAAGILCRLLGVQLYRGSRLHDLRGVSHA